MPERIIHALTPAKNRWLALERRQQIQIIVSSLVILAVLILILFFAFRTTWVVLFRDRESGEMHRARAVLEDAGIRVRPSPDNSRLYVPARNEIQAGTVLFESGAGTTEHMTLATALDLAGLGTTESERAAMLLEVHETRVRDMLMGMNGISNARVSIVPADRNLMLRPNQPPSSMAVTLETTRHFTPQEGRTLAEHLRTTVRGLELDNITIVDQNLVPIFLGNMVPDADSASDIHNLRFMQEALLLGSLESSFSHIFDDVTVMGNFQYDGFINREDRVIVRNAPAGTEEGLPTFLQTSQSEAEGVWGGLWPPGIEANNLQLPPWYGIGAAGPASASARDRTVALVHDEHEIITHHGPGGMDRENTTIGVIATLDTFHCEERFFELNPEYTRDDWLAFENNTPNFIMDMESEYVENLRYIVATSIGIPLANVAVMIQERNIFVHAEETRLPIETIIMLVILLLFIAMLLLALLARRKDEEEEEVEPELSVEDLLATTQLEEAKDEEARLKEIDYETDNEVKKQIDKFVNEKPEAVAALLRNWLNAEEW